MWPQQVLPVITGTQDTSRRTCPILLDLCPCVHFVNLSRFLIAACFHGICVWGKQMLTQYSSGGVHSRPSALMQGPETYSGRQQPQSVLSAYSASLPGNRAEQCLLFWPYQRQAFKLKKDRQIDRKTVLLNVCFYLLRPHTVCLSCVVCTCGITCKPLCAIFLDLFN